MRRIGEHTGAIAARRSPCIVAGSTPWRQSRSQSADGDWRSPPGDLTDPPGAGPAPCLRRSAPWRINCKKVGGRFGQFCRDNNAAARATRHRPTSPCCGWRKVPESEGVSRCRRGAPDMRRFDGRARARRFAPVVSSPCRETGCRPSAPCCRRAGAAPCSSRTPDDRPPGRRISGAAPARSARPKAAQIRWPDEPPTSGSPCCGATHSGRSTSSAHRRSSADNPLSRRMPADRRERSKLHHGNHFLRPHIDGSATCPRARLSSIIRSAIAKHAPRTGPTPL